MKLKRLKRKMSALAHVTDCYNNCQKTGHIAKDCKGPKKVKKGNLTNTETSKLNLISTGNNQPVVKVKKESAKIKTPEYKTPGSAAVDLYPSKEGTIPPFATASIPTGLYLEMPGDISLSLYCRHICLHNV